jgi:tetratricopeptide (TPR) repeat protein
MPRACFGRDELVEKVVGLAEGIVPIALIGPGGIGKTSIALAALHHSRAKELFGENRRFIRCDQFPASRANFLRRLSKVIGAGVENPEDLVPLRPFLSSKKMFIVLDNADSILDPQGVDGQEIYGVVEELSQFSNICLCITSRITTIPPDCEALEIPTLSKEAAHDTFYRIYSHDGRSDSVNNILKQLDFHPLSVTLLATVAFQNKWDDNRLAREWEQRQTGLLQTGHNRSLAGTVELSLASPMFQDLGPDARGLLEVVAFFPNGVNENNLDWLFPTVSDGTTILDKFCILSLAYRSDGFIKMLAPLRDYLRPKDPKLSPLLCTAKERYFARMSVTLDPDEPGFKDARWIALEHVNVEHLLNVFTSIDVVPREIWDACANFMQHLYWHKKRKTMLGAKIEGLPDCHPSKPTCLLQLSRLFQSVGNHVERKRLLAHALKLEKERGNNHQVARTLMYLSDANRLLFLREEGIQQAGEALKIFERLGSTIEQAECLNALARLLHQDKQFDAAEAAASRAIILLPDKGQEFRVCQSHRALGGIHRSKREREKAIHHFEIALRIASPFNWNHHLFWIHHSLARLFSQDDRFDDAHAHIEQAKSHATENAYRLGTAIFLQAEIWYQQHRLQLATSQALRALDIFEKLGSPNYLKDCRKLLGKIEKTMHK